MTPEELQQIRERCERRNDSFDARDEFARHARTDVPALLDEVELLLRYWQIAEHAVVQARQERDEARAEAKELREVLTLAGERLKACSYQLTEFSYQEMASVLFDLPCNTEEPTNG